jgi:hypothetical protein
MLNLASDYCSWHDSGLPLDFSYLTAAEGGVGARVPLAVLGLLGAAEPGVLTAPDAGRLGPLPPLVPGGCGVAAALCWLLLLVGALPGVGGLAAGSPEAGRRAMADAALLLPLLLPAPGVVPRAGEDGFVGVLETPTPAFFPLFAAAAAAASSSSRQRCSFSYKACEATC